MCQAELDFAEGVVEGERTCKDEVEDLGVQASSGCRGVNVSAGGVQRKVYDTLWGCSWVDSERVGEN